MNSVKKISYAKLCLYSFYKVLWSGSGWKPVPLVDIIEGSGVKKAYQKALLCLHPDKLQQKGAASHQKYIAARVFDILQVCVGRKIRKNMISKIAREVGESMDHVLWNILDS